MTKFRVTLKFNLDLHNWEEDDYRIDSRQRKSRQEAFQRTDDYYYKHDPIAYIKSNDALDMVEYIVSEGEVLSAEWDKKDFAIHMTVETDQTADELGEDLQMNSLEDGEYEACGETGWILFTRGPNDEVFNGGEGSENTWEYGLVDYRKTPASIEPIT
jgi:hypothetical protein